jgi:MoaA/NifB/PqqE/SkfB family radical SAM enzyme
MNSSLVALSHAKILKGPHQIAFDITNRCNYKCLHCFNRSGENWLIKDELSNEEVEKFVKDIAELKPLNFCFCGGEPLLRKDVLYKSAVILSSKGIIVSLVTNGSLVTKEIAKELKRNGVKRIQVSLDGANPESVEFLRKNKKSFNYAVNAISIFAEEGFEVGVAFAPTRKNWNEIEETYRLVKKLGARSFRVQPLMIIGRAQLHEEILPTPLQYREIVRTINKLKLEDSEVEWGDPVDHLIRFRTICEHLVNFVNIKANGGIAPSPYLPIVVGNIRKRRFTDYWEAGLARIWEIPLVKRLASKIVSNSDFGKEHRNIPRVWFDKDIELDIIDDNLFGGKDDERILSYFQ